MGSDWHVVHVLFSIAIGIYTVVMNLRRADRHELDRLKGRVEGISRALTEVQSDIKHVPKPDQVTAIVEKLSSAVTGIDSIKDRLERIEHRFGLYEEAALKRGRST